jgi:hypothetical protein
MIGSLGAPNQISEYVTLLKFQKNSTERRKTNPTSTNSLEMIFGKVGISVRSRDNILDMLANERTKMRGDSMKRKSLPAAVKLEKSANDNMESIQSPNETRRPTKFASIDSGKRTSIHNMYLTCKHAFREIEKKHFNFIGHMS